MTTIAATTGSVVAVSRAIVTLLETRLPALLAEAEAAAKGRW
jgi:hypothetical protein